MKEITMKNVNNGLDLEEEQERLNQLLKKNVIGKILSQDMMRLVNL